MQAGSVSTEHIERTLGQQEAAGSCRKPQEATALLSLLCVGVVDDPITSSRLAGQGVPKRSRNCHRTPLPGLSRR